MVGIEQQQAWVSFDVPLWRWHTLYDSRQHGIYAHPCAHQQHQQQGITRHVGWLTWQPMCGAWQQEGFSQLTRGNLPYHLAASLLLRLRLLHAYGPCWQHMTHPLCSKELLFA
jgi:hypothetical protein